MEYHLDSLHLCYASAAGSPEVMTLVYKAMKRGYAVVAMGAHRGGDKWRCYETHWPPEEHHEIPGVSNSDLLRPQRSV